MKGIAVGFVSIMITLLPCEPAWAWSHANRYGGSTSHRYGEGTVHTNAYGGGTAHAYGGTVHANPYGGTTSHAYGGAPPTSTPTAAALRLTTARARSTPTLTEQQQPTLGTTTTMGGTLPRTIRQSP